MRKALSGFLLAVLFLTAHSWAAETPNDNPQTCSLKEVKQIKDNSFVKNKHVHVDLKVVAPGQPEETKSYRILYGSTAADVLKIDHQVKNGVVCCRPDDIKSVNSLDTDFAKRQFWSVDINGNADVSPTKTLLSDGDKVTWTYHEGDK